MNNRASTAAYRHLGEIKAQEGYDAKQLHLFFKEQGMVRRVALAVEEGWREQVIQQTQTFTPAGDTL